MAVLKIYECDSAVQGNNTDGAMFLPGATPIPVSPSAWQRDAIQRSYQRNDHRSPQQLARHAGGRVCSAQTTPTNVQPDTDQWTYGSYVCISNKYIENQWTYMSEFYPSLDFYNEFNS